MSINDLDTSNKPQEKTEVKTPDQISPPAGEQLEHTAIADIMGLEKSEMTRYHDKVDTLLEWAKTQTEDHSPKNLKWVIRELGFKLGTPPLGQKLVNWLAEFAYLDMESKTLNKKLEVFKHGK